MSNKGRYYMQESRPTYVVWRCCVKEPGGLTLPQIATRTGYHETFARCALRECVRTGAITFTAPRYYGVPRALSLRQAAPKRAIAAATPSPKTPPCALADALGYRSKG